MNLSTRPNFFILGAPKCGTTSLASWLSGHSNIFMCVPKEPRHFNRDYAAPGRPKSDRDYERLFSNIKTRHKAIGEASTGYLRSREAVPRILKYSPDALFIVCLRNPIEMVRSVHSQLVKMGTETEINFDKAWAMQESRRSGENIPITCHDTKVLQYGKTCLLGSQMATLFSIVPRKRVLVIFLEDMKTDPKNEYRRVLKFLGLEDDNRNHFPVENARAIPRLPVLSQILRLLVLAKDRIGWRTGLGIGQILYKLNNRKPGQKEYRSGINPVLYDYFKDDIKLMSKIMDRDLTHWLAGKEV